jgi:hypothetical protein
MNARKLLAAVIVSACATGAYAANTSSVDFANTFTPYEVTAQNTAGSSGAGAQAKSAGAGEQALPTLNFGNSAEPSAVTAQSPAQQVRSGK